MTFPSKVRKVNNSLHADNIVHVDVHIVIVVVIGVVVVIVVIVVVDGGNDVDNSVEQGHGKRKEGQL